MIEADPNTTIRDYVTSDRVNGWPHKKMADKCYQMADVFNHFFFSPKIEGDAAIPNMVLAFPELSVRTLAQYRLVPNALGLSYEISLNSLYLGRPEWEVYESLLHEMVHLYQENTPGLKKCVGGYHNQQFVDICEEVGLHPLPIFGAHWKPADDQYERLMDRYMVLKPEHAKGDFQKPEDKKDKGSNWFDGDRGKKAGKSTLIKYVASECTKSPTCSFRAGRRDLQVKCQCCDGEFKPVS